jgi:serralysin
MLAWSNVANVRFVADSAGTGQVTFGAYQFLTEQTAAAYAYELKNRDSTLQAGDIWLNASMPDNLAPDERNLGNITLLHEVGHAIGLQHPDESGAWPYDSALFSVLSKETEKPDAEYQQFAWANSRPGGPMVLDIAAIQALYGANYATNAGNTTYRFSANLSAPDVMSIWDGSGIDSISAENQQTGAWIDLRPGHYSAIGTGARDKLNIGIALNCDIENATGRRRATATNDSVWEVAA